MPNSPSFVRRHAKRLKGLLTGIKPPTANDWKDIEYFDEAWKERIRQMARYVPAHSVVMDLGCGKQWLRDYLDHCRYIPVDYCSRSPDTLVCDFNRSQFPDMQVDVCYVSGCLEYVENPEWLIGEIAAHAKQCVISYCALDNFSDLKIRASLGWKNSLKRDELISLFAAKGMRVDSEEMSLNNSIFCFVPK